MEGKGLLRELKLRREFRTGIELGENGGVFQGEFVGGGGEVEVSFEERGGGQREGLGRG